MNLIIGLGNPGRGYANSRHNVGFTCLNYFAREHGIRFDKKQGHARIGMGEITGGKVILARPQTYMNLSGQSVSLLVKKYHISLDNLLVIHDDLDLPPGKIRIRLGGGSGGHRGVDSIITCLESQDFPRLRVGIGRPAPSPAETSEDDIIDYVLGEFSPEEKQTIIRVLPVVSDAILCLLTEGTAAAMNRYN